MKNPTISIITPVLNSEATIEACLQSVADQTYDNIEHLIIDGLSIDRTIEIVKNFQSRFSHIRLISERDNGIYDAMNKGIKLAGGSWIYFLGSDDILLNTNTLNSLFLHDYYLNYDVIYGNVLSTRFSGRYDYSFDGNKILEKNICHQAIFFNKKVFRKTGPFNLKYKSHADWDHNMKWLLNDKIKKKYIDDDIAVYSDGGFSSVTPDKIFEQDKFFNYLKYGIRYFPVSKSEKLLDHLFATSFRERKFSRIIGLFFLGIRLITIKLGFK